MLKARIEDRLPIRRSAVFSAISDPRKLSQYFTSSASGPVAEGASLTWNFSDVGARVKVKVRKVVQQREIHLSWNASGAQTDVKIELISRGPKLTIVRITESGWPLTMHGASRAMGQTQGWMDFFNSLKAYLLFKVDLRRGRRAR